MFAPQLVILMRLRMDIAVYLLRRKRFFEYVSSNIQYYLKYPDRYTQGNNANYIRSVACTLSLARVQSMLAAQASKAIELSSIKNLANNIVDVIRSSTRTGRIRAVCESGILSGPLLKNVEATYSATTQHGGNLNATYSPSNSDIDNNYIVIVKLVRNRNWL